MRGEYVNLEFERLLSMYVYKGRDKVLFKRGNRLATISYFPGSVPYRTHIRIIGITFTEGKYIHSPTIYRCSDFKRLYKDTGEKPIFKMSDDPNVINREDIDE